MPNGKGFVDCSYCVHWRGLVRPYSPDTGPGVCKLHRARIPEAGIGDHRLCTVFTPTKEYRDLLKSYVLGDGTVWSLPLAARLRQVGRLADGFLYAFSCTNPFATRRVMKFQLSNSEAVMTPHVISGFLRRIAERGLLWRLAPQAYGRFLGPTVRRLYR